MSTWSTLVASLGMDFWGRFGETSGSATLVDSSSNARTGGTWEGSPTLEVAGLVNGDSDTAASFANNANKFGAIAYDAWLNRSTYSIGILFATTSTAAQFLVQRWGSTGGTQAYAVDLSTSNVVRGYARINDATQLISATVTGLRDGNRHLVMLDWDGTTLRLYVDGTSVASSTPGGSQNIAGTGNGITIARRTGTTSTPMIGTLDEFMFGPSLSSTNHAALWSAANAPAGTTVNLGLVSEATTVQSVTASMVVAVGVVTETTTVHSAAAVEGQLRNLPTITESTTVHSIAALVGATVAVGLVSETVTVHPVTSVDGSITALQVVTETTTVFGLSVDLGYGTTRLDVTSARNRSGIGYASWTPAVVETPTALAGGAQFDKALAFGPVTIVGTQPTFDVTELATPRHRDRIIVGGRDVTYFRGAEVQVASYQLMEPYAYGTATLEFPQVYPDYEEIGAGDLSWLTPGKRVLVQRVDAAGNVVATDYKGRLIAPNASTGTFSYEVGGEVTGPASLRFRPMPLFRSTQDVGWQIWRALSILGVRATPRLGVETGIELGRVGGMPFLDYLQSLTGRAWTRSGNQWTVMPNEDGVYETKRKDRSTIHGTVYLSASSAEADLRRDIVEEPNRVYATGVTPSMMRVRNGRYPGLQDADDVPFPGFLTEGATGDDVLALIHRLRVHGYLNAETAPGGYDADVTAAVEAVQEEADLNVTGNVNEATWNAIFDTTAMGVSLKLSRIEPMAQRVYTRKFRTSASGAIIGRNPNYDPTRLKIDREVDFGTGFTKPQMREWSRAEIQDGAEPNWVGTLTIHSGAVVAGEHTPGDPILEVLAARDIRPGMNLWLPQFQGGTLVHVTAASVSGDVVTLQVDTRARDAWNAAQVIERDRESRKDPARAFFRRLSSSVVAKDAIGEFSEVGGIITEQELRGNEWNVIEVVAGDSGTIRSLRLDTNPNAESSVAIFGKKVWPKALQRNIGDPLTTEGTERWRDETVLNRLRRDHGLLYSAGDVDNPGGYSPGHKDETAIFTGRLEDEAGVQYYTEHRPLLYVAVWVDRDCTIPAGRIIWPLLEPGS